MRIYGATIVFVATLAASQTFVAAGTRHLITSPATRVSSTLGSPVRLQTVIRVPGITNQFLATSMLFSFGDGRVDSKRSLYLLSDHNAGAVDVFDTRRNVLVRRVTAGNCRLCRFAGLDRTLTSARSGPGAIALVGARSLAWIGDVGSVKLIDYVAATILNSVPIETAPGNPSRFSSRSACYDAADQLLMVVNPEDPTPFVTIVDTRSETTVRRFDFPNGLGLGGCVYSAKTHRFYLADGGSPKRQIGALSSLSARGIRSGSSRIQFYAHPNCSPRGLAIDASRNEILVACDAITSIAPMYRLNSDRIPLQTARFDERLQRFEPSILEVGGAYDVAFDAHRKRWYVAAWRMTADGFSDGAPAPALGIVDATTNRWIANVPTGADAHSVAVDGRTGQVYVPIRQTSASLGGVMVFAPPR